MNTAKKSRASSHYWIDVAVKALSEKGPDALTIEALCRETGKTKGSFYAHFSGYDAFLSALAERWKETNTDVLTRTVDTSASPSDASALLNHLAVRLDPYFDRGMRRLAYRNSLIAEAVRHVDEQRIAYMSQLNRALKSCSEGEAKDLATLEYAAYVGLQQIYPDMEPCELDRLYKSWEPRLTPHHSRPSSSSGRAERVISG